jgi:hypothetical protein
VWQGSVSCGDTSVKARQLINGASFGPAAIKAMSEAFDLAWEQIASHFDGDPMIRDSARQSLAEAVLAAAAYSIPDVQTLKDAGLSVMASKNNSLKYTVPQTSSHV